MIDNRNENWKGRTTKRTTNLKEIRKENRNNRRERRTGMKQRWLIVPVLLLPILALAVLFMNTDKLEVEGISTYTDPEGRVEYVLDLTNGGFVDVTLLDAWVNDGERPDMQLGVSFSSMQMVQAGIDDPAVVFMELDAMPIRPKLSPEAMTEAVQEKDGSIPTLYGLRFAYAGQVESVTIKYRVLGMVKTKKVTRWF